jgi:bacterioferritin
MSTKEDLIQGLNEDLAAEYGTIIRYTYQSGKAFGLLGAELRELLAGEIIDELGHAAFLTDVIVDLGGEPVTEPVSFDKPEGLREMLALDQEMELQDVQNYVAHAELAGKLGYVELKLKLEEMAADEAGHARELRRILRGL